MRTRKRTEELKFCFWICASVISICSGSLVTEVQPHCGSKGGDTKLTVFGAGFSKNQFTLNDEPHSGNQVYLVSTWNQYRCPVIKESSSESIIVCLTPSDLPDTTLYVRVVVDGIPIDKSRTCGGSRRYSNSYCRFTLCDKCTPSIRSLEPHSGVPGTLVKFEGKLFTDVYGDRYSDQDQYDNPLTLRRVYVGPNDCDLEDDGQFFGLALYGSSDYGYIICKTTGTAVGFFNASFVLDSPYGRSVADADQYRVSYNDQIYLYQIYTDITNISHAVGSVAGGLALTIYGKYFDESSSCAKAKAYVGDTVCELMEVVPDAYIVCIVAAEPDTAGSKFQGNRGVMFEYWTSALDNYHSVDDILTLSDAQPGYNSMILDETYFENYTPTYFASRMTSFFRPPHTGEYQFFLLANGDAKIFVDGVAKTSSSGSMSWRETERIHLVNSTKYLLQIVHRAHSRNTIIHLKVKYFGTHFTRASVNKAVQEEQTIQIRSTVSNEVQRIVFSEFTGQTYVQEVQIIDVDTNGEFRFGIYGVYTEPLMNSMSTESIQRALDKLPVWGHNESTTVIKNETNPQSYQLTFNSSRGDFPDIDVVSVEGSSSVNYSVIEDTRGVSDLDTVALVLDGVVSEPFSVASLDAGNTSLKDVVLGMFDAKCPDDFQNPDIVIYYENFETGSSWFDDHQIRSTDAFCGKYVLKNPDMIYQRTEKPISLPRYGTMCFAYKGAIDYRIRVSYMYVDFFGETKDTFIDVEHYFINDKLDTWHYTCVDLNAAIEAERPFDTMAGLDTVKVNSARGSSTDIYIDSVSIGRTSTTDTREMHLRRLRPILTGKELDGVYVTKVSTNTYEVTFKPAKCRYDFPMFDLANSKVQSVMMSSLSSVYGEGERLAVFDVIRISDASPPVNGSIDISFNGKEKRGLNVLLEENGFKRDLETLEGIGAVKIQKTEDCFNFDIKTTFLTLAGDQPQLEIKKDQTHGKNASCRVITNTNGGLYYDPLTGDMLSTVHENPQVRLFISDIPTWCSGDCSFKWDSSITPTVTSYSTPTGDSEMETSIVIHGTGFSDENTKNHVLIGDTECRVTASDSASITCDIDADSANPEFILVNVDGKGYADGKLEFVFTAKITSISPVTGSLGGGVILTIYGFGFRTDASVSINSQRCTIKSLQRHEIQCVVPPSKEDGEYEVVVNQGSNSPSYSGFIYNNSLTAKVTSISQLQKISVFGGLLTITGSSFTSITGSVSVGIADTTIMSWSDTEITILVPEIDPGVHIIGVKSENGFALNISNGELPTLYVELIITDVYPRQGSLLGGTKLTISGNGFGNNASEVEVKLNTVGCTIITIYNTQIVCRIDYTGKIHHVTNKGVDPAFGVYYAFDQPYVKINEGDMVHWSWETPDFVNSIAHSIIEVEHPSSLIAKPGGVNSGTPSRNGYHIHRFNQAGIYYVWSGFVDIWNIKNYDGTVEVVPANSTLEEVNVLVGNKKALHSMQAVDETNGLICQSNFTVINDCEDTLSQETTAIKFLFAFCRCLTPVVNTLNVNNGTTLTNIEITGHGFSDNKQDNEVYLGKNKCNIITSTDHCIVCNHARSSEPELGIIHHLEINVCNYGFAQINIRDAKDSGFALLPSVETITPKSGSMAGGTEITVTGFGLGQSPLVLIDHFECAVIGSSDDYIYCETPPSRYEGNKEIEVFVSFYEYFLKAVYASDSSYAFSYELSLTPIVSSISPDVLSQTTSFFINGTLLGNEVKRVDVIVGGVTAKVEEANQTYMVASVDNIRAGENEVIVKIKPHGKAQCSVTVLGQLTIYDVNPLSGSIYGGTKITIRGNGFVENETFVKIGDVPCNILSTSLFLVTCITNAHSDGSFNVEVSSNKFSTSYSFFNYSKISTPIVTNVVDASGYPGDIIKIFGSNLGGTSVTVLLGQSLCDFINGNNEEISCTVGNHSTGRVPVSVNVPGLGGSNTDIDFDYQLSIQSIAPIQGSVGGGQIVLISGTGFDTSASVTICGQICLKPKVTFTSYSCQTSAHKDETCDVEISLNGLKRTLSRAYWYNSTLTPSVTNVSPKRGGTGGGTKLTITGSGFRYVNKSISVEIDGTVCNISTVTETEIECITGAHTRSLVAKVQVVVARYGFAKEMSEGDASFQYIDLWSSIYTWGGGPLPLEGEFVVIPTGATILLDIDTPVLSVLLIQGHLEFDEIDIELQANIIIITDGGYLQVGTEDKPFQHKAIITLHGHVRSKELPLYGTKVLAVRNGTLDLHGTKVQTWTRLASTASAGNYEIHLSEPVDWKPGDEIAISTTGNYSSQYENERNTIFAISDDKLCLTLQSPLKADHVSAEENFEGTFIKIRGEVGLLTHNIVVRGNKETKQPREVQPCKAGVNTAQSSHYDRFNNDIVTSQFGAHIMAHAARYNSLSVRVRISYTEIKSAGQAFRQGRHPVYFHLNGDMSTSYIRGCSIHDTYNRAINIRGSHNIVVEKTVFYNILGVGICLEDGIETGNTLQYNLAIFIKGGSRLNHVDIVPAAFLITNPNNTVQHNAAAGGTHFGYWYKTKTHPDGLSFTRAVIPQHIPLGTFRNNSAHSFKRVGLRIFRNYFPQNHHSYSKPEPAHFENVYLWNNYKGVEVINSGPMHFEGFVLVQNELVGYECKMFYDVPHYKDDSPVFMDSIIVGTTNIQPNLIKGCTKSAIVLPYGRGFRISNVTFVNFANPRCAALRWTRLNSCSYCGGFTYKIEQTVFLNVTNIAAYEWEWEGIIFDKDGTATGKSANWTVLPSTGSLPSDCEPAPRFSAGIPASMCPPQHKWHRFAFTGIDPNYMRGRNFIITNEFGNSTVFYRNERLTHEKGWMCALLDGSSYTIHFEPEERRNNLSFGGLLYDFEVGDHIIFEIKVNNFPDRFYVGGRDINITEGGINITTAKYGDWLWINEDKAIQFIVIRNREDSCLSIDIPFSLKVEKCFYKDCIPPPDPNTVAPVNKRPFTFEYWHDTTIWNRTSDGYMTNVGDIGTALPQDYDNIRILFNTWVLVNRTDICKLGILLLEGVLEFLDFPGAEFVIEAEFIIIKGGRLIIGWPNDPFDGFATIILRGNHSGPDFNLGLGNTIGSKSIGVYGGLDLTGKDVGITWTQLATTSNKGSRKIVLLEPVAWKVGDEIVISSTSVDHLQAETFAIASVHTDNVTLTLNGSLRFKHIAHTETLTDKNHIELRAGVGLLTRNIKIMGQEDHAMFEESFGARIKVGQIANNRRTYTGYARLINVEFYHTGQKEPTDIGSGDAKLSLLFRNVGRVTKVKPSIVSKCSFHHGYSSAVGAVDVDGLEITSNVLYSHSNHGIMTTSQSTRVINNLIVETQKIGIEAFKAIDLTLENNLVSGAGEIGYHVPAVKCEDAGYHRNKMYSNRIGGVFTDVAMGHSCLKISGFTSWKSSNIGLYYNGNTNVTIIQNELIENQVGLNIVLVSRRQLEDQMYVAVQNTTFVGQTSSFECSMDYRRVGASDEISPVYIDSRLFYGQGMFGMVLPHFHSLNGVTTLTGVTFSKYRDTICKKNYALTADMIEHYNQAPTHSEKATVIDVTHTNKIIFQRPVHKVTHDCVNMECAAFKYVLFKDLDGSFLGHPGSVVPDSEYARIDECRVPIEMITDLDGKRIPFEQIAPNKGIIRTDNCTYQESWQAYECYADLNYELLKIQNMDLGARTRHISPIALLGDGYMDLLDVPQDHIMCKKLYTCKQRKSTFYAMVATGKKYLMHFTGTTPRHLQYTLLNDNLNEGIKLTVWYSRPNRLDVFVNGNFVIATNARIDQVGRYIISMPNGDEYEPQLSDETGTNFFDRTRGELTVIIKGPAVIDVITQKGIIVSFGLPVLTVSEFFGENIVENLAAFFDIPLTKVRIVNIVSETGRIRYKRSDPLTYVEVEIGDGPEQDMNSTLSDSFELSTLVELASNIVNECQLGDLSETFNFSIVCESVSMQTNDTNNDYAVYETVSPSFLFFYEEPEADYEGVLLKKQPKIRAADADNNIVPHLGTLEYPWQMTVTIRDDGSGQQSANLSGTVSINSTWGWFNFTDLVISPTGTDFILDFTVTYPEMAKKFILTSETFDVIGRPLKINVHNQTTSYIFADDVFEVTLELRDQNTDEMINNIQWRNHTWSADVSMLSSSKYGSLNGMFNTTFDVKTGRAVFQTLSFNGFGIFFLTFTVLSDPPEYNLTLHHRLTVRNIAHVNATNEDTSEVKIKFGADYQDVLPNVERRNEFEQMILTEYANTLNSTTLIDGSVYEGSIGVTILITGSKSDLISTVYGICDAIYNGTVYEFDNITLKSLPYMIVNGTTFYGVKCGEILDDEEAKEEGMVSFYLFVLPAAVVGLLLPACVLYVVCKHITKKKMRIQDSGAIRNINVKGQQMNLKDILFSQDNLDNSAWKRLHAPPATTLVAERAKHTSTPNVSHRIVSPFKPSIHREEKLNEW